MNEIDLLKQYRKKHNKTYEQIGRDLGISTRTIYRWLQEEVSIPSPMAREKIVLYVFRNTPANSKI